MTVPGAGARLLRPAALLRDILARALHRRGVSPDAVSLTGCILSLGAGACLFAGATDLSPWSPFSERGTVSLLPFFAACLITASGFLDVVDGALARLSGRATARGALLDSTLDRVSDLAVHAGIVAHAAGRGDAALAVLALVAFSHGVLIAYLRARAEALIRHAATGFWQRSERVVLLGFGCAWGHVPSAMMLLAVLPAFTAWRRYRHASRLLSGMEAEQADAPPAWAPRALMPWRASRDSLPYSVLAAGLLLAALLLPLAGR